MKKRMTALFLAIALLCALLPSTLLKASATTYSGTCGYDLIWTLDTATGELAITGTGAMSNYATTSVNGTTHVTSAPWGVYYNSIVFATIGDSVTSIGNYAFYGCTRLKDVKIGNSVENIGDSAFRDCNKITNISIPDCVTVIGVAAFYNCTGLTSVTISDSVMNINSHAFYNCEALNEITFPNSVTTIDDYAFGYCTSLTSITIGNGANSISETAFICSSNIEQISVAPQNQVYDSRDNCNAINVTESNILLIGCKNTRIPKAIMGIGNYAFYGCVDLTNITIPTSVTEIGSAAFYGCAGLKELTLPTKLTSIGASAFERCGLTSISIPNGVTSIGNSAFSGCTGLASITIPDSVTRIGYEAFFGTQYYSDSSNWIDSVLYIGNHLIKADSYISGDYEIRAGTKTIASYAFAHQYNGKWYGCYRLTSITIPDSVISIGYEAFYECTGLKAVNIFDIDAWYNIDFDYGANPLAKAHYLYLNGVMVTDLEIPDSVTSIGNYAFEGCNGLTSITLSDSVTNIGIRAFNYCRGITSITIPNSVMYIGDYAFAYCSKLEFILFVGDPPENGSNAFANVWATAMHSNTPAWTTAIEKNFSSTLSWQYTTGALTDYLEYSIDLPSFELTISGPDAIPARENLPWRYFASRITSLTLKDGVTEISASAFEGMSLVKAVTIPESVERIMNNAFQNCTSLEAIEILNRDCVFGGAKDTLGVPETTIIYGYANSTAQTWAASHGYEFCPISVCGDNHNYSCTEVPPTCTIPGTKTYICTVCGYSYTETIPALGHDYVVTSVTPATATTDGVRIYTCTRCGATMSEVIPATGEEPCKHEHTHQIHKDATCTASGYDRIVCDDCGNLVSDTTIPKLGHSFKTTIVAPTCTERGYTFYECTREGCGYTEKGTWTDALGHYYVNGVCIRCNEKEQVTPPTTFSDVKTSDWFYEAVNFAVSNGLMNGVGNGRFAPNDPMTRAMLVTVLWRYEGSPTEGRNIFSDVPGGQWYTDAVAWAAANSIVGGVGNGKFDPNGNITREQMAAILYRYAEKKGFDTSKRDNLSLFSDKNKVSNYAKDAIRWAVAEGLISGNVINGKTLLDPQGNATRAQVATILMRFIENIAHT